MMNISCVLLMLTFSLCVCGFRDQIRYCELTMYIWCHVTYVRCTGTASFVLSLKLQVKEYSMIDGFLYSFHSQCRSYLQSNSTMLMFLEHLPLLKLLWRRLVENTPFDTVSNMFSQNTHIKNKKKQVSSPPMNMIILLICQITVNLLHFYRYIVLIKL